MISDTLSDASGEIKRYLTDEAFAHVYPAGPLRDRIEACLAEMDAIRIILDTPPRPSCCGGGPQWGHAWDCPKCPA